MTRKQHQMGRKCSGTEPMALRRPWLILALAATDSTFVAAEARLGADKDPIWVGKCIHCRSPLMIAPGKRERGNVTLEHIVPQGLGGTDVLRNLALACARCNNQKGSRLDGLGLQDPKLAAVIEHLQAERQRRHRPVPANFVLPPQAHAWLRSQEPEGSE